MNIVQYFRTHDDETLIRAAAKIAAAPIEYAEEQLQVNWEPIRELARLEIYKRKPRKFYRIYFNETNKETAPKSYPVFTSKEKAKKWTKRLAFRFSRIYIKPIWGRPMDFQLIE